MKKDSAMQLETWPIGVPDSNLLIQLCYEKSSPLVCRQGLLFIGVTGCYILG